MAESVRLLAEQAPGADLVPVAADVSSEEGAARVLRALPQVDILVNNLGRQCHGRQSHARQSRGTR